MNCEILIDLTTLNLMVHGHWWFDLDEAVFDQERGEFRLNCSYRKKGPYNQNLIKVTDVSEVSIDDAARIGIYNLHDFQLNGTSVVINSEFPLRITLAVGPESKIYVSDLRAAN